MDRILITLRKLRSSIEKWQSNAVSESLFDDMDRLERHIALPIGHRGSSHIWSGINMARELAERCERVIESTYKQSGMDIGAFVPALVALRYFRSEIDLLSPK